MKNFKISINDTSKSKFDEIDSKKSSNRSTDINILLNRVKLNKKSEIRKKFYFSTATALGLVLFGIVIF